MDGRIDGWTDREDGSTESKATSSPRSKFERLDSCIDREKNERGMGTRVSTALRAFTT